jgi:hypothetical protein
MGIYQWASTTSFYLIFTVITFFSVRSTNAQILVGPVVGGQINGMVFDDKSNKDLYKLKPMLNFHAGASISFRALAQKRFFLQTSILYSQKSKLLESNGNENTRNETKYRYIDMPILYTAEFKAKLGREKVYKWYFGVGPTISYWLGGKGVLIHSDLNENIINPPNYDLSYKITFKGDSLVESDEMNIQEPNRIQLGLNAAVGLIFEPYGQHKIMVAARYAFGQSFLAKSGDGVFGYPGELYYEDELQVRSRELVLSLHYYLDLKTDQRKKGKSTSKVKSSKRRK